MQGPRNISSNRGPTPPAAEGSGSRIDSKSPHVEDREVALQALQALQAEVTASLDRIPRPPGGLVAQAPHVVREITSSLIEEQSSFEPLPPDSTTHLVVERMHPGGWRSLEALARATWGRGIAAAALVISDAVAQNPRDLAMLCVGLRQLPGLRTLVLKFDLAQTPGLDLNLERLVSPPAGNQLRIFVKGLTGFNAYVRAPIGVMVIPTGRLGPGSYVQFVDRQGTPSGQPQPLIAAPSQPASGHPIAAKAHRTLDQMDVGSGKSIDEILRHCETVDWLNEQAGGKTTLKITEAEHSFRQALLGKPNAHLDFAHFGSALATGLAQEHVPRQRCLLLESGSRVMGVVVRRTQQGIEVEVALNGTDGKRSKQNFADVEELGAAHLDQWVSPEVLSGYSSGPLQTNLATLWAWPAAPSSDRKETTLFCQRPVGVAADRESSARHAASLASLTLQAGDVHHAPRALEEALKAVAGERGGGVMSRMHSPSYTLEIGFWRAMKEGRAEVAVQYLNHVLESRRVSTQAKHALLRGAALDVGEEGQALLSGVRGALTNGHGSTAAAYGAAVAGAPKASLTIASKMELLLARERLDPDGVPTGPPALYSTCSKNVFHGHRPKLRDEQHDAIFFYASEIARTIGLSDREKAAVLASTHRGTSAARAALNGNNPVAAAAMIVAILQNAPPTSVDFLLGSLEVSNAEVVRAVQALSDVNSRIWEKKLAAAQDSPGERTRAATRAATAATRHAGAATRKAGQPASASVPEAVSAAALTVTMDAPLAQPVATADPSPERPAMAHADGGDVRPAQPSQPAGRASRETVPLAAGPQSRTTVQYHLSPTVVRNWLRRSDFFVPEIGRSTLTYVETGSDLYVPSVKYPHVHIGSNFIVYSATRQNHHYVVRGDQVFKERLREALDASTRTDIGQLLHYMEGLC